MCGGARFNQSKAQNFPACRTDWALRAEWMHDNGFLFLDGFDLFWEMGNDTGQTLKDIQTCQLLFLHTSLVRGKMALMKGRGDCD